MMSPSTQPYRAQMANTVADVALLLSVIAGADGLDPRQIQVTPQDYLGVIACGIGQLRIGGAAREGFGHAKGGLGESDPEVDRKVRAAAKLFEKLRSRCDGCIDFPCIATA